MPRALWLLVLLLALAAPLSLAPAPAAARALPSLFVDEPVTSATLPTALAFAPDGRMLIAQQTGELLVYRAGAPAPALALDLKSAGPNGTSLVCANLERGLLGVAVDPEFAQNGVIYLYYTWRRSGFCPSGGSADELPLNRVARFTMRGDQVDTSSQRVLVDAIGSPSGRHNGGDLDIPADGHLYISVGDGGINGGPAQNLASLNGKILRVDRATGAGVAGNPFFGAAGAQRCGVLGAARGPGPCEEIFALGLRNPFRMAFRPNTSEFHINDVGQRTWEEVNLGRAGANYGWPEREGPCAAVGPRCDPGPQTIPPDPLLAYRHGGNPAPQPFQNCNSITDGAFVPPGAWPAEYDGAYLFADYTCHAIFRLLPRASGGADAALFGNGLLANGITSLTFGADGSGGQALYYASHGGGNVGRIRFTGGRNAPPVALAQASASYGRLPLAVQFSSAGSADADGSIVGYAWDFGDGAGASGPSASHTYTRSGVFEAVLTVTDGRGASGRSAPIKIFAGNEPPIPTILAPLESERFVVGQSFTLRGQASDPEDGPLPAEALVWQVTLHHDAHTHPFLEPTSGDGVTISAPAPEDLAAVTTSYLRIDLRARDKAGLLSPPVSLELRPKIVSVTLESDPPGMQLQVNDGYLTTPASLPSWPGYICTVLAPSQIAPGGARVMLVSWDDQPNGSRAITTPDGDAQYRAIFAPARSLFLPLGAR
jgi:glucose/arabinose dehydrogenase/PKD repeat protein